MRKQLIVGNWKMNKDLAELKTFFSHFKSQAKFKFRSDADFGLAIPFVNIAAAQAELQDIANVQLAAQDVSQHLDGAYTGEISAKMLKAFGVTHVIVGHSERRAYHHESDAIVNTKARRALDQGIVPIICVGETLAQYEAGQSEQVVKAQITGSLAQLDPKQVVVAYEPIWAIGTGKTATVAYAQKMCAFIRSLTSAATIIQYGGSVNPKNIDELLAQPDIDGALVGGASLEPASFLALISNK